jgi:hypothetical protein
MRLHRRHAVIAAAGFFLALGPSLAAAQSDAEIRRAIIKQSLAAYPGPCPCPYSVNRSGRPCGSYNAYSKPGGRSPICYERDVTAGMVEEWRRRGR